ncbi:hypothetical protein BJX61DRAFT_533100 [Aspergillus egyptiacus]|nr:hypothetical protein BJX61DRAFT_533100 [Aspergillus egyptiacus]
MADAPLTPAVPNEHLWKLIRRFDKALPQPRQQQLELDLNRAADEEFTAAKLQKTVERFYIAVVTKCNRLVKHVNRLRSWDEPRRTGAFGAVYLIAWLCNSLIPVISTFLVALMLSESVRSHLFPPLLETQPSGTVNEAKPVESTAEENTAEANTTEAEQEATRIVDDIATSVTEVPDEAVQPVTSDPVDAATLAEDDNAEPIAQKKTSPAISVTLRVLSDIADLSERFSNLLSPSPPFDHLAPRLRLAGILISVSLVSLLLSGHMIVKTCSLTVGLTFFGDPLLSRAVDFLNRTVPDWKSYLDIHNTLLKGIPTDAQLTLTLLRLGELSSTPLPPPPSSREKNTPFWQIFRRKPKQAIADANPNQENSPSPDASTETLTAQEGPKIPKPKKWLRILKFARRTITTAIKGHVALNRAISLTGLESRQYAQGLLRAVLEKHIDFNFSLLAPSASFPHDNGYGPYSFEAKFERKRGTAVIDDKTDEANPIIYFTSQKAGKLGADLRVGSQKSDAVMFQVSVAEIAELTKTDGLGWKGKLIVRLAAGTEGFEGPVNEGLVIRGTEGQIYHLTDLRGRNWLFNRLVASSGQYWELY